MSPSKSPTGVNSTALSPSPAMALRSDTLIFLFIYKKRLYGKSGQQRCREKASPKLVVCLTMKGHSRILLRSWCRESWRPMAGAGKVCFWWSHVYTKPRLQSPRKWGPCKQVSKETFVTREKPVTWLIEESLARLTVIFLPSFKAKLVKMKNHSKFF